MTGEEVRKHDIVTFSDLKVLAGASGPCITIVAHIPTPFEFSTRMRNAIRAVENKLQGKRIESSRIESLLSPIHDLAGSVEREGVWSNAVILFRSPEVFLYFLLYRRAPEVESVEDRFQVGPLLSVVTREQRFHILALSRKHIRLFHSTKHRAEEISIEGRMPQNMEVWLSTRQPDHVLDNRAAGGPSVGSMKGVTFGTGTDREREDEYLAHFYKQVDKGVNTLLRNDTARLLLSGVEYEVPMYRRVSTFPRLFDKEVLASPDGLPDPELHKRAMDVVMQIRSEPLEKALTDFEKRRDTGRFSTDPKEVIKAAWQGRVADLFLREGAEIKGAWNEEMQEVDTDNPREDLLNAAALQTLLHGGRAFALESNDMPVPNDVAAALRF
jgi:hypothetical protein